MTDTQRPSPGRTDIWLPTPDAVRSACNADPEFLIAARYLSTVIRLSIGAEQWTLTLVDGRIVKATDVNSGFDPYTIVLAGPETTWRHLLAETPVPYFQDFWSAQAREDFSISGDVDLICAYYPALQRLGTIMRTLAGKEAR